MYVTQGNIIRTKYKNITVIQKVAKVETKRKSNIKLYSYAKTTFTDAYQNHLELYHPFHYGRPLSGRLVRLVS